MAIFMVTWQFFEGLHGKLLIFSNVGCTFRHPSKQLVSEQQRQCMTNTSN